MSVVLDPSTTALVLIDLQNGIVSMPLQPRGGAEVVVNSVSLTSRFRDAGAKVILVNVRFAKDYADSPPQNVDQRMPRPEGGLPDTWSELVEGLAAPGDIRVTKHNWGAFFGTDLDVHLRRRGIRTIVLGGIATSFGVESTARQAWEHGYDVVIAEDCCAAPTEAMHRNSIETIFPRIARVRAASDLSLKA